MVLISIVTGVHKPTNITRGPHIVSITPPIKEPNQKLIHFHPHPTCWNCEARACAVKRPNSKAIMAPIPAELSRRGPCGSRYPLTNSLVSWKWPFLWWVFQQKFMVSWYLWDRPEVSNSNFSNSEAMFVESTNVNYLLRKSLMVSSQMEAANPGRWAARHHFCQDPERDFWVCIWRDKIEPRKGHYQNIWT